MLQGSCLSGNPTDMCALFSLSYSRISLRASRVSPTTLRNSNCWLRWEAGVRLPRGHNTSPSVVFSSFFGVALLLFSFSWLFNGFCIPWLMISSLAELRTRNQIVNKYISLRRASSVKMLLQKPAEIHALIEPELWVNKPSWIAAIAHNC
jgi:hypothetical protein